MLRSLKQLYGSSLSALNGEIGRVKDFYFEDRSWVVRYVVVDAGDWVPERQILLSPHAFCSIPQSGDLLLVNLTRKQIENSPAVGMHKPVSRQYEEDYYRYYGLPFYWQGAGLWGGGISPILELPENSVPGLLFVENERLPDTEQEQLRSTLALEGYQIRASDGDMGHLMDFMMDCSSWAIDRLVVKTGHWPMSSEVRIPVDGVERISYEDSEIRVHLTRQEVQDSPPHHPTPEAAAI